MSIQEFADILFQLPHGLGILNMDTNYPHMFSKMRYSSGTDLHKDPCIHEIESPCLPTTCFLKSACLCAYLQDLAYLKIIKEYLIF